MAAGFWPTDCATSALPVPASGDDQAVTPAASPTIAGTAADRNNRLVNDCKTVFPNVHSGTPAISWRVDRSRAERQDYTSAGSIRVKIK